MYARALLNHLVSIIMTFTNGNLYFDRLLMHANSFVMVNQAYQSDARCDIYIYLMTAAPEQYSQHELHEQDAEADLTWSACWPSHVPTHKSRQHSSSGCDFDPGADGGNVHRRLARTLYYPGTTTCNIYPCMDIAILAFLHTSRSRRGPLASPSRPLLPISSSLVISHYILKIVARLGIE
jgi:hypothetical protein